MNCDELDKRLTPYIDGEAPPGERARVEEHLVRCRPCAQRASVEQAARRLVQLRARSFSPAPPRELRARCAALAHPRAPLGFTWLSWKRLQAAGVALLVLVVGAAATVALFGQPNTFLVAGLTLDHVKCFALSGGVNAPDADARAVEASLERDYGWRVHVPASAARERLRLVGARRCLSSDGSVAHLLYRHDGRAVSLFVVPSVQRQSASTSFAGYPARVWSRAGSTFVLVASESDAAMRPVARYFAAAVQ